MEHGKWNAITDVPGVRVGHVTLDEDRGDACIRTGVTAILPHGGNPFEQKVSAGHFVLNGFGKTAGLLQIEELGLIESPVMLTNTLSVASVLEGTLRHMLKENPAIGDTAGTVNIVVGECNDGYLNSIRELAVKPEHAEEAIRIAEEGPVAQGAVGAGRGMVCFGAKGGIGTSSRVVTRSEERYTVGVLTLTNFGDTEECLIDEWLRRNGKTAPAAAPENGNHEEKPDGSVIIVVATDAPLDSRQLTRLARRAAIGLGRTGTNVHNGSGDIIISFSNAQLTEHKSDSPVERRMHIRDDHPLMKDLFVAAIDATEEAVFQSLLHAETTDGRLGRVVKAWPK